MYESASVLLQVLHNAGHEACFVGEWCLTAVHNEHHPEFPLSIINARIATSATPLDILRIFPDADATEAGSYAVRLGFGNDRYTVTSYRRPTFINGRVVFAKVDTLAEDLAHRAFTVDTLTQLADTPVADAKLTCGDDVCSAVDDIREGIIRAVGDPVDRLREDPLRVVRAFRLMAELGYTLDPATARAIRDAASLLSTVPSDRIGVELRRLVRGRSAAAALQAMADAEVFTATCTSTATGKQIKLLPALNGITADDLQLFTALTAANCDEHERWASLGHRQGLFDQLEELVGCMTPEELVTVRWVHEHADLPALQTADIQASRLALLDAVNDDVRAGGIHLLKKLVLHVSNAYNAVHSGTKECTERLFFNLCARPYVGTQLKVLGWDMLMLTSATPGPWMANVKRRVLHQLAVMPDYPEPEEIFKKILPQAMSEEGIPLDKQHEPTHTYILDEFPVFLPEGYTETC